MTLLLRTEILPLYAQVCLLGSAGADYPQFDTGEEEVVAASDAVVVSTRSDYPEGRLGVEVWREVVPHPLGDVRCAFDGRIDSSGELVVGNVVANDLHSVPTARGSHRLRVYLSPTSGPADKVCFLLDPR